tara:strand:+ start:3201 stop:3635 length:435 start_codon:yes stop_codon:yes gene_type:complete
LNSINLWNKALDILSRREHSSYELKTKLKKFETDEKDLNQLIQKLKASNFVDDRRFATAFIKSKSQSGYGPSYISQYLLKKGISSDLYDINLLNIDWEYICREQFEKKRRGKDINFKEREKILRFLAYRGFSYEIIKNALKDYD